MEKKNWEIKKIALPRKKLASQKLPASAWFNFNQFPQTQQVSAKVMAEMGIKAVVCRSNRVYDVTIVVQLKRGFLLAVVSGSRAGPR